MNLPNEHNRPGDASKPDDHKSKPGSSNSPRPSVKPSVKAPGQAPTPTPTVRATAVHQTPTAPIKPRDPLTQVRDVASKHQNPGPDGNDNAYLPPKIK